MMCLFLLFSYKSFSLNDKTLFLKWKKTYSQPFLWQKLLPFHQPKLFREVHERSVGLRRHPVETSLETPAARPFTTVHQRPLDDIWNTHHTILSQKISFSSKCWKHWSILFHGEFTRTTVWGFWCVFFKKTTPIKQTRLSLGRKATSRWRWLLPLVSAGTGALRAALHITGLHTDWRRAILSSGTWTAPVPAARRALSPGA